MSLWEIKVEIPASFANAVEAVLLEHGLQNWNVLEDVIQARAWVVGICADETLARVEWANLVPLLTAAGVTAKGDPACRALGDADWRDSYKAHFHAWQFGRLHWVPIWERDTFTLPPGDAVLWLDPGLAFGTGNHETTRLCVERLVALAEHFQDLGYEFGVTPAEQTESRRSKRRSEHRKLRVVDAGCGSGILALSAVLLGFPEVRGFDNDPEAVRISEENAAINDLGGRVRFEVADVASGLASEKSRVDVLLANIQADVLMRFARELVDAVSPGGTLVLSGILASENAQVRGVFERLTPNWTINARVMGEWSDVVLARPI